MLDHRYTRSCIISVQEPIGGQLVAQSLDWDQWQNVGGPVGCTGPCTHCIFTVCVVCVCVLAATPESRNGLREQPFYFRGLQGNENDTLKE